MIHGEIIERLDTKLIEMFLVLAVHPARGMHSDRVEHAGDSVFIRRRNATTSNCS
jgi:hypothetical protein